MYAGLKGWASYRPYITVDYMIATKAYDTWSDGDVSFSGLLSGRVRANIGPITTQYPNVKMSGSPSDTEIGGLKISIPAGNIVYSSGPGDDISKIALGCNVVLGLDVEFGAKMNDHPIDFVGPDVSCNRRSILCKAFWNSNFYRSI